MNSSEGTMSSNTLPTSFIRTVENLKNGFAIQLFRNSPQI
jgi:hypothetical protein